MGHEFEEGRNLTTIGIDLIDTTFNLPDGTSVKLKIYDSAGQERFYSMNDSFYSKVDSFILVYNIQDRRSFERCSYFSNTIKQNTSKNIKVFLIGNKLDCENRREVSKEEGLNYAISNGYYFYETSCKNKTNIQEVYQKLIEETVKAKKLDDDENGIDNLILTRTVIKGKKKSCC